MRAKWLYKTSHNVRSRLASEWARARNRLAKASKTINAARDSVRASLTRLTLSLKNVAITLLGSTSRFFGDVLKHVIAALIAYWLMYHGEAVLARVPQVGKWLFAWP